MNELLQKASEPNEVARLNVIGGNKLLFQIQHLATVIYIYYSFSVLLQVIYLQLLAR